MMLSTRFSRWLALSALSAAVLTLSACSGSTNEPTPGNEDGPLSVPNVSGKADNYISTNAREFELKGSAEAKLPSDFETLDEEARQQATRDAVDSRLSSIADAIRSRVETAVAEANSPESSSGDVGVSSDDSTGDYFMYARPGNEKIHESDIVDGSRVQFQFEWELVGSPDLAGVLVGEETGQSFTIEVPAVSDTGQVSLNVDVAPSPSNDAFPKYQQLFKDGVYDIGLHFGGDYNEERYDIEMAKWAVQTLQNRGWSNPEVDSFDDLKIDSPPFTKSLQIQGRTIEARVYLYHPEMPEDGPQSRLTDKLKESFAKRDVVLYNGHAGPGAGFILDYHPRHEVKPSQFKDLPMADKYQIFVINGCETYRSYVPDLMANERKTFDNVDIVTTVNKTPIASFSRVTYQFLRWLTYTDKYDRHTPMTWNTILQGVNKGNRADARYGVHGIDQDPEINPYGNVASSCQPCQSHSQCGAGGNYCLRMKNGPACGTACATSEACGEGFKCAPVTDDPDKFYIPKQCIPKTYQCR
jgi:hypothetical protein